MSDDCLTFNKDEIVHVRYIGDDYIFVYVVALLTHKLDVFLFASVILRVPVFHRQRANVQLAERYCSQDLHTQNDRVSIC